jgi:hypothetical protein
MLRFLAGAGSALLLIAAGFFIWSGLAQDEGDPVPDAPEAAARAPQGSGPPRRPPSADERTKEQRRFDRADRDNDGRITLAELLYPRQRPFQRLDANRDGRLSFEEWAVRTREKFGAADADRDGNLNRTEYAVTAPRPRPPTRTKGCAC